MPDPITLSMLASGAISGAQLLGGALTKVERPTYTPAAATTQAVNIAERESNATLAPGYAQYKQGIEQNAANAVSAVQRNATSSSDVLAAAGAAQGMANRSMSDLVRMSMQDRVRRKNTHMQTLQQLAREQNHAFQVNSMEPYQNSAATKSALLGAGLQGLSSTIGDYAAYKQMQPPKEKNIINLPTAQPIGFQDMANGGQSWGDIIASLNR